jgi:hypothetical protein
LFQISNCDTIQPLKPNGATVKSKVFLPIILLGGSLACGGSSYPEGYSEADKACFDYGAEACEMYQTFCAWEPNPEYEQTEFWWNQDGNESYNDGYDFQQQHDVCAELDSNNEAYYSGAVDSGCDLQKFSFAATNFYGWSKFTNSDFQLDSIYDC